MKVLRSICKWLGL